MDVDQEAKRRRSKGLGYLRDGRLQVLQAFPGRAGVVAEVLVRGHFRDLIVEFDTVAWSCTCDEHTAAHPCAHVYAAELVVHAQAPMAPSPGK